MRASILKLSVKRFLALALAVALPSLIAQTSQRPSSPANETRKSDSNKQRSLPFNGKLAAVDKSAKTITIGQRTFQINSDTKIFKANKPASLGDGVVGERVTGSYKKSPDGKLLAGSVYFGGRNPVTGGENTKKKQPEK